MTSIKTSLNHRQPSAAEPQPLCSFNPEPTATATV